ncbi:MAG: glycosyltransferase family 4 protein [Flavobacteriales bacterium]|nr:glycosyltransferase family 4 protein [Flavobacteriales bacterium]
MNSEYSVFQIGSRMHYAIPEMLEELELLETFYTDIVGTKGWPNLIKVIPSKLLPVSMVKLIHRQPKIPSNKIKHYPMLGLQIGYKLSKSDSLERNLEIYNWYNKAFQNLAKRDIAYPPKKIYSFNGASLELFETYKDTSLKVLEQTIAPFFKEMEILEPHFSSLSNWSLGELNYHSKPSQEFANRELEEMKLADKIICASDFVKDSMIELGVSSSKIKVVPYGVNLDFFQRRKEYSIHKNRKLKVLTVGRIGVRKGAHHVLEIAKRMKNIAEFTMVGPIEVSDKALVQITEYINVVPSVSKEKLLDYYEDSDVFLLPSLCEGSATVVYEALAMGLPCVVTKNTGSILTNGIAGFVTETNNLDEIESRLISLLDSELRIKLAEEALELSKEGSINAYKQRLKMEL